VITAQLADWAGFFFSKGSWRRKVKVSSSAILC
jgi:hypothetical protein